jgi:hypothetical protein
VKSSSPSRLFAARQAPASLKLPDCLRGNEGCANLVKEFLALAFGLFFLGFLRADVDLSRFLGSAEFALLAAAEVSDHRRDGLVRRPEEFLAGQDPGAILFKEDLKVSCA